MSDTNIENIPDIKTKEQIAEEITQKLSENAQGVAVAASMLNSLPVKSSNTKLPTGPIEVRRFEITLYEEDEDASGRLIQKIVNGGKPEYIEATSPSELQEKLSLYKACGQTPKVKEVGPTKYLDPVTKQEISPIQAAQSVAQQITVDKPDIQQPIEKSQQICSQPLCNMEMKPIKYYKIGGIDIKDDNGKIYQKQWVRLSENEEKNIRIINDKNNAIVNLTGKHIEMMKWTLVEDVDDNGVQ